MSAAEQAPEDHPRRALDQRIFRLGYPVFRGWGGYNGHHPGCMVGMVSGAPCRCDQIGRGIRARYALMRRG
jgi:hypothetical protein